MEVRSKADIIVSKAREWVGTPYMHGQRAKGRGTDCIGYAVRVYGELGLIPNNLKLPTVYPQEPESDIIERYVRKYLIKIEQPIPGCIGVFKFNKYPQHLGIITRLPDGALGIIHASLLLGRVVEHYLEGSWLNWVIGYYAPQEILNG